MAELKTKVSEASVVDFLNTIEDEQRRADCYILLELLRAATGAEPKMWGDSIVGFGDYHYQSSKTGRGGDWFIAGFSPRKQNLTLYSMGHFLQFEALLKKLGKHKTGTGCLYINKLQEIDLPTLRELIQASVEQVK